MLSAVKYPIPEENTLMEQVRDQNGKAFMAWVDPKEKRLHLSNCGLAVCNRCGEISVQEKKYNMCPYCDKKTTFEFITPLEIEELWKPYVFDREEEGRDLSYDLCLDRKNDLYYDIIRFISQHLVVEDDETEILAKWVVATYFTEKFDAVPYLQFIAPIASGKTRALEVLSSLAYRGHHFAFITPAALSREFTLYHTTAFLDQAEKIFDYKNIEATEMYNIFMSGYKKGQHYMVAKQGDDTGLVIRDVFGFKALASTTVFDEALDTRSITFHMKEAKPHREKIDFEEASRIRNALLLLRLSGMQLNKGELSDDVTGRLREIYSPLLLSGLNWDYRIRSYQAGIEYGLLKPEYYERVEFIPKDYDLEDFIKKDKQEKAQDMRDSIDGELLAKICDFWENPELGDSPTMIRVKDLADPYDKDGAKNVGHRLKAMNIKRKRNRLGTYIDLEDEETQKQLRYLFEHYHIK